MTVSLRPLAKCGNVQTAPPTRVQALKMAMMRLSLSQHALSRRLKCERSTVRRWCAGECDPKLSTIEQDAEFAREFYRCAELLSRTVNAA